MTPVEKALEVSKFIFWAKEISPDRTPVIIGPDHIKSIHAAAEELQYLITLEVQRSKQAREKGRKGGRPKTKSPTPSTLRSRASRAKMKRKGKGRID